MNASQRGFSLIEVVVTLSLIGLLASMAAPLTETLVRRGKEQELRNALYQIRDGIDAYKRAFDAGYIEKSLNSSGYPPNLQVLVEGVRDVRSAKGAKFYFLRRIPRDPLVPAKRDDEGVGACAPTTVRLRTRAMARTCSTSTPTPGARASTASPTASGEPHAPGKRFYLAGADGGDGDHRHADDHRAAALLQQS